MSTTVKPPASTRAPSSRLDRVLVTTALASTAGFLAALVAAGFVDPGYSHRSEAISALASTESEAAGLMTVGVVFLGMTAVTAGAALLRTLRGKAGRAAGVLVVIAGVLTMACGFARQSCSTLQQSCLAREAAGTVSVAHWWHNLMAPALFACLVVAAFLLASALRRDARWVQLSGPVRAAAVAAALAFVWFGSGAYGTDGGLVQRLMVLLAYGIPVAVAVRVTRDS